jgi:radical SAM superfamily enzyme YgiQ (UPF0313 family)
MNDILLINPPMWSPEAQSDFTSLCPPLGLGYLASNLAKEGIQVKIIDLDFSRDIYNDLKELLGKMPPRVVGITTLTQNYFLALQTAGLVKKLAPGTTVVMGGPHVSYTWEEVLKNPSIDIAALFEGEQTMVDIFHQVESQNPDFNKVKGIAFRGGDKLVCTPVRSLLEDLDSLPYPARHLLPINFYRRPGTIMTSRGCPVKCIFCISSTFEGNYRPRSAGNVVGEIESMRSSWGIREFYFIDNVFTVNRQRVEDICRQLITKRLNIFFNCVSRVDLLTVELVKLLKAAGCIRIEIGVESGAQQNIDAMEKKIKLESVFDAVEIVAGAGIRPMFTFQIGSPYDTPGTIQQTHELAAYLRSKGALTFFSIMTPYPGTPLALNAGQLGITIHARSWQEYRTSNPVYDTRYATRDTFRKALYLESLRQMGGYPAL